MNNRTSQIAPVAVAALIAAAVFASACVVAFNGGMHYDEGYHLQVPLSLVTQGQYASTKDGSGAFDPYVSPGPTLLVPIAGSLALLGPGVFQARLVMLVFLAAMLVLLWLVTRRLFGDWEAAAALAVAAVSPSALLSGATVLGEMPGVVFLLGAVFALTQRRFRAAGLLVGLAALTKFVFIVAFAPIAACAWASAAAAPAGERRQAARPLLSMALFALAPLVFWEALQVVSLGLPGYFDNKYNFVSFLRGNSGISGSGGLQLADRMAVLGQSFGVPGLLAAACVVLAMLAGWAGFQGRSRREGDETARIAARFLWVFAALHLAWWLVSPNKGFWRYAYPGYVAAAPFVGAALVWLTVKRPALQSVAGWAAAVLLAACLILRPATGELSYLRKSASGRELAEQRQMAAYVKAHVRLGTIVAYWGWWQAPEIQFLSRETFHDITRGESRRFLNGQAAAGRRTLVITAPYQERFTPPPGNWVYIRKYCGDIARQIGGPDGWTLWKFLPDSDPQAQYKAALKRGDLADLPATVEPVRGKAVARQVQAGLYEDGWMERRAGVWIGLPPGARTLEVSGEADLAPFGGTPVRISVSIMGRPRVSHTISASGPFVFRVPLGEGLQGYSAVKVTLYSDRWYVPREQEKRPQKPSGIKSFLRSLLRDRLGLRIPDYRELSVRVRRVQAI